MRRSSGSGHDVEGQIDGERKGEGGRSRENGEMEDGGGACVQ